jgi:hypothetical protein
MELTNSPIEVYKTSDSGASWSAQDGANNPAGATNRSMAVWFDQETKDNSGALLHIAFVMAAATNEVHYIQFDTSDDTWGTDRTIDSLTVSATSGDSDAAITVAKSGRVYVAARGDYEADTENTDHSMLSSTDGFATAGTSEGSPYSADEEVVKLFPGAAADADDICAVVFDAVNQDLEFWKYDESAGTWGVTAIDATSSVTGAEARSYKGVFDAVSRHSDEHILVVYWNAVDSATGDFRCVDITQATPTITQKANIDTDTDDSSFPSLLINQQNDDVYVAYCGSDTGDELLLVTVICYFKKSDDDMTSWGTEQTYGIENDDLRMTSLGRTIGNSGGRIMPAFYDDDDVDIFVNDGNDVEIAAADGAPNTRRYSLTVTGVG